MWRYLMNFYENIVILNPSLSEQETTSSINKIADLIKGSGGEVLKVDNWGKRKLAYEINKQKMGFYILFLFKSPSSVIRKIEEYFKVFDPVMKFMVIKLNKKQIEAISNDVMGIPVSSHEIASSAEKKTVS